jgi:(2Fe-2S) ferredoxin
VVVIYPEGVWYRMRTDADVLEVMDRHIGRGEVVDRLVIRFEAGSTPA